MKAKYRPNDFMEFEIESDNIKEIFSQMSTIGETFPAEPCGLCKSAETAPNVRKVDKYTYYELKCQKCGAKLSYGQNKDGVTLYPRRIYHRDHPLVQDKKVKADERMPHRGWEKFSPKIEE